MSDDAGIRRAGTILNRKNSYIEACLRSGELPSLGLDDIAAAIERNVAGHSPAGQAAARERLRRARAAAQVMQR